MSDSTQTPLSNSAFAAITLSDMILSNNDYLLESDLAKVRAYQTICETSRVEIEAKIEACYARFQSHDEAITAGLTELYELGLTLIAQTTKFIDTANLEERAGSLHDTIKDLEAKKQAVNEEKGQLVAKAWLTRVLLRTAIYNDKVVDHARLVEITNSYPQDFGKAAMCAAQEELNKRVKHVLLEELIHKTVTLQPGDNRVYERLLKVIYLPYSTSLRA